MTRLSRVFAAVRRIASLSEVRHDVALFVGILIATGVFDRGAPLTFAAIGAAVVTAGRRAIAARIAQRNAKV
jgi:hypothetical protein